jgi:hypothetical protein
MMSGGSRGIAELPLDARRQRPLDDVKQLADSARLAIPDDRSVHSNARASIPRGASRHFRRSSLSLTIRHPKTEGALPARSSK